MNQFPAGTGDLKSYLIIRFNCRSVLLDVFNEAILFSLHFKYVYIQRTPRSCFIGKFRSIRR